MFACFLLFFCCFFFRVLLCHLKLHLHLFYGDQYDTSTSNTTTYNTTFNTTLYTTSAQTPLAPLVPQAPLVPLASSIPITGSKKARRKKLKEQQKVLLDIFRDDVLFCRFFFVEVKHKIDIHLSFVKYLGPKMCFTSYY